MHLLKVLPIALIVFVSGCTQYQSTETITPQYSLESIDYPTSVKAGEEFTVSWKVNTNTPTTIKHTAVHYTAKSNPGEYTLDVTPANSGYTSLTADYASGNFTIPNTFSVKVKTSDAGKLYFRMHAIIDENNYWTPEYSITVEGTTVQEGTLQGEVTPQQEISAIPPLPTTKEFTLETDDIGYYTDGQKTTSVSVAKGDAVKITFKLRTQNIYSAGAEYRGCGASSPSAPPGGTTSMQFTASSTCTITAYWPASGVAKASMQVIVS